MALKNNTWKLNQWYDQSVAGNISYTGLKLLWGYGSNSYGGLGQNSTAVATYSSPIQVSDATTWNFPPSGMQHSGQNFILTKTDGTLWSWGYALNGTLGQNAPVTTNLSSPTQIPGTTWATASAGRTNAFAIKTDGTLWTWGTNYYGILGLNQAAAFPSAASYSSPVQIPGTTWDKIYSSNTFSAALKTDGTLWMWGYNTNGNLAQNNRAQYSSPVQIPGTTWAHVGSGSENAVLATKTDGTLWGWGKGGQGGLGQNTSYPSGVYVFSSPVQIPGTTWDVSADYKIANADYNAYAIKTDGTMWVWGSNAYGQLGLNERTPFSQGGYSSPVQLPGTTWKSVSATYGYSISATKTDGTLWQWARNSATTGGAYYGDDVAQSSHRSSPVQLPGTWGKVLVTRRSLLVQKVL